MREAPRTIEDARAARARTHTDRRGTGTLTSNFQVQVQLSLTMSVQPPLLARLAEAARKAKEGGALRSIASRVEWLPFGDAGGAEAPLRVAEALERKEAETQRRRREPAGARAQGGGDADALGRAEPLLVVEREWTATHSLLLNKFNVAEPHVLLVTRAFEPQESGLSEADAEAAQRLLDGGGWLVFYNCGPLSGASQPRKHLQAVRWPFDKRPLPLDAAATAAVAARSDRVTVAPGLPFRHALRATSGVGLLAASREVLARVVPGGGGGGSYNLLATREWVLAVPRVASHYVCEASGARVPVNALGFAGSLFVRSGELAAAVRRAGVAAVLAAVAGESDGVYSSP